MKPEDIYYNRTVVEFCNQYKIVFSI